MNPWLKGRFGAHWLQPLTYLACDISMLSTPWNRLTPARKSTAMAPRAVFICTPQVLESYIPAVTAKQQYATSYKCGEMCLDSIMQFKKQPWTQLPVQVTVYQGLQWPVHYIYHRKIQSKHTWKFYFPSGSGRGDLKQHACLSGEWQFSGIC